MNSSDEDNTIGVPSILSDNGSEDECLPSDSDEFTAGGANDGDNEADAVADYRHNETDDSKAEATVEDRPKICRKRQTKEWKCNERKRKRNSGTYYVSRKGTIVAEKQFSNLDCRCKKGCFNKITEQARKVTFEPFWKIGTHSAQNVLICGFIKQETPQRQRPTTNTRHQKSTTNAFYLSIDGKSELVCKYFLETLKISDGRMTRVLKKVKIGENKRGSWEQNT